MRRSSRRTSSEILRRVLFAGRSRHAVRLKLGASYAGSRRPVLRSSGLSWLTGLSMIAVTMRQIATARTVMKSKIHMFTPHATPHGEKLPTRNTEMGRTP
jgi:hypothetical protein